jgi:hypothetical protein
LKGKNEQETNSDPSHVVNLLQYTETTGNGLFPAIRSVPQTRSLPDLACNEDLSFTKAAISVQQVLLQEN